MAAGASGAVPQPTAGAAGAPTSAGSGGGSGGAAASGAGAGGALEVGGGATSAGAGGIAGAAGAGYMAAGAAGMTPYPTLPENVTLHIAGDSTAAIFPDTDPTKRVGWGAVAQQFFLPGATVDDAAQSGRSSKSFIAEGFWASVKTRIKAGDYVFIEFGHNDEKVDDVERYTDPATTYRMFLKQYISETRALGGYAVLLTPISRRKFAGTQVALTHGAYPAAVFAVGIETGTPVIDMETKTGVWIEALGPVNSIPYFAVNDTTHLNALGAPEVAKLVMQGIRELAMPISQRLVPEPLPGP